MERMSSQESKRNIKIAILVGAATLALVGGLIWAAHRRGEQPSAPPPSNQGIHKNITTTVFWVGEDADASNRNIHNRSSVWTEDWVGAFGGIDNPEPRCDLLPCDFTPQENSFYFALPYNDLDDSCQTKPTQAKIPWVTNPLPEGHSAVKNRWIEVRFADKTAYAQWEDAGPFGEDDFDYVFGQSAPQADAGLDLSPATAAYLGLDGEGQAAWKFVPENAVPGGPWRQTITTSLPDCAGG